MNNALVSTRTYNTLLQSIFTFRRPITDIHGFTVPATFTSVTVEVRVIVNNATNVSSAQGLNTDISIVLFE